MSSTDSYPLYPISIILPIIAILSIILDIPPLIWHISQRNIAAWSLILWTILTNSFLFINPLIWPRDNLSEWWDGQGLCDVQARITVGSVVALPCAVGCIMRKLAMIMDTRHMTVAGRSNRKVRENVLEILWCWGCPVLLMVVYYFVQPIRYFIFGISGCGAAYDASWPSIVAVWMWQPIIKTVGSYYAVLLLYRLYRYRREFSRLIAARDTTKSRFIRLLIMSLLLCFGTLPYSWYLFHTQIQAINGPFIWSVVHGPKFNRIIKVPSHGAPYYDTWGRIAVGYAIFFVFGTGRDAKTLYKKMLVACGLGRIWSSLHNTEDTASRSRSSSSRSWFWLGNKTKSFWSSATTSRTMETQDSTRCGSIQPMDNIVAQQPSPVTQHTKPSFFRRIFSKNHPTILPLHAPAKKSFDHSELSPTSTYSAGPSTLHPLAHTHAWVEGGRALGGRAVDGGMPADRSIDSTSPLTLKHGDNGGVTVMKEVKQERNNVRDEKYGVDLV